MIKEVIYQMNRNTKAFDYNPVNLDISRTTLNLDRQVKTSFNAGEVVPLPPYEVLPGDTFNVRTSKIVRLQTLLTPVMDNIYLDFYYYFVPCRLLWEHWKQFMGENTTSAWIPSVEYQIPKVTAPVGGWEVGTIADYLGIPTGISGLSVNALPFRAYALIINEWFRDQNVQQPLNIPYNDTTVVGVNTGTFVTDVAKGGKPYIASKFRDYFTSCLPEPQKGVDVSIGLSGEANVFGDGKVMTLTNGTTAGALYGKATNAAYFYGGIAEGNVGVTTPETGTVQYGLGLVRKTDNKDSGLYADLAGASAFNINDIRTAFAIQRFYEKSARGGTRYIEIIRAQFGVTSPDSRQQRPEYLGGNRVPLNINQVVQQSQTDQTPMGDTAAYSLTRDNNGDFVKSFTEHGYVMPLMVVRYDHTYQQGLDKMWSRDDIFDFYWPVFANLGETAVLNQELYAQGTAQDKEVFGYQEAWAEYRYMPNKVTGEMRSTYAQSLDVWHLGDDYSTLPTLSDGWMREDKSNIDRVLAVQSSISHQLFADIYIANKATRPMPLHSIPGLADHH